MASKYTQEDEVAMREYISTLPPAFHEYADDFAKLRLSRVMVETFVSTAKRHGAAWWVDTVDEHVQESLAACMDRQRYTKGVVQGKEHVTHVKVRLSEKEQAALKEEYASVTELTFAPFGRGEIVEHAMANAARVIANVQLRRMLPKGSRVLEVGAKVEHVVMMGPPVGSYMGCVPVLDHHDSMRHSSASRQVRLMLARTGRHVLKENQRAVAQAYVDNFESVFTREKVQNVKWPAETILSLDANYDVPMSDMPKVMHRTGARIWLGSMVRCPQAAIGTGVRRGYMPTMGFDFVADADADTVAFYFRSSSRPYKHRLSVYREYMSYTTRVFRIGGDQFVFKTLPQTVPSQLFYAMYRIDNRMFPEPVQAYVPTGNAGMLRISTVVAQLRGVARTRFTPESFDVPEETFSRMLQDRMLLGPRVDDAEVVRTVRGSRLGFIVNGVQIQTDQPLAVELIKPMVVVLNLLAEEMFEKGEETSREALRTIREGGKRYLGVVGTAKELAWHAFVGDNSLCQLVRERMDKIRESAEARVEVVHLPAFESVDSAVVELGDGGATFPLQGCVCADRAEAAALLTGERGGLSECEAVLITKYLDHLRGIVCERCEVSLERIDPDNPACFDDLKRDRFEEEGSVPSSGIGGSQTSDSGGDEGDDSDVDDSFCDVTETDSCESLVSVPPADGFVRDALEEFTEINERRMIGADSKAQRWADVLLRSGENFSVLDQASDLKLTHHLLEVSSGLVVGIRGRAAEPQSFARVYDYRQGKFFDAVQLPNGQRLLPRVCSDVVYTNSDYQVWNYPQLIAFSKSIMQNPRVGPVARDIRFVNGVFGCGKTTEIVSEFRTGDKYLSATRASVSKVRRILYRTNSRGRSDVRTYDSAAIHGMASGGRVFLDEVPMAHAGLVLGLLEQMQPDSVVMYGDFYQIPYISFLADYQMRFHSLKGVCKLEMRPITHRCRVSICAAVLPYYGETSGLGVCRCCEHIQDSEEAFFLEQLVSVSQIPLRAGVKYITFTQAEKDEMNDALVKAGISGGGSENSSDDVSVVSTVHEVQGGDYTEVALVRTCKNVKPDSIYHSNMHVNTAVTRAKEKFTYYTVSDERDVVVQWFDNSRSERLRAIVRANSI